MKMLRNKEVKNLFVIEGILLILSIFILFIIDQSMYNAYKEEKINNDAYLVEAILKNHPELEEEVIKNITKENIKQKEGRKVLEKYGIDDIDNLDFIGNNKKVKEKIIFTTCIYMFCVLSILFFVFFLYLKRIYKNINNLSFYTSRILNGEYTMNILEYQEGEFSHLKNDLYKMTIKLKEQNEQSLKDKKYLESTLQDISHQLKTPLTSMYVINDLLSDKDLDEKTKKEMLHKNKTQLQRIEWLVSSLLKMSRLDSGSETLKRKKYKAKDLIYEAILPVKIPLELKNIYLKINCNSKILLYVDKNWTIEALLNIVKNACEHTPLNGKIEINCIENPLYTEIRIIDNGEGISDKDKQHVFERFYKGTHNKESIGIGLNMAKTIIEKQNGEITVISKEKEGTTFCIRFYKNII